MAKILTIGSVTKDMFFPTSEGLILDTPDDLTAKKKIAFELGAKYDIETRFETLGGCAINVACGLARLGENVSCYVGIGNDDCGKWILEAIAKEKIDSSNVEILENINSDLSTIIIDKNNGERTIFSNHGASKKFAVDNAKINGYDWIFIGDLSGNWKENLETILKSKEDRTKVAFNPRQQMLHDDSAYTLDILSYCDVVFLNKDEATELVSATGKSYSKDELDDERFLLETLRNGKSSIVITDGDRGAWALNEKQELLHADSILTKDILDTTGAGDAFASGFLAAHIKGKSINDSLKWGIANSSSSIKKYGGQEGLLNQEIIKEFDSKIFIETVN